MPDLPPVPRPLPGPAPDPEPRGISRRWFLAGGCAVLLAAGAGVAAAFVRDEPTPPPAAPPAALVAAVAVEQALIADLVATTGGSPAIRRAIADAHADHVEHLHALQDLVAGYGAPAPSASRAAGTPRTAAQLRAAEMGASAGAARRAAALDGAQAALLASISACEATHADQLS